MRRHLTWVVLLLLAPTTYLAGVLTAAWLRSLASTTDPAESFVINVTIVLAGAVATIGPVVFLILAIVQMTRTYRRAQRRRGRFTSREKYALDAQAESARAWEHARAVRAWLIDRRVPQTMKQWDVIPQVGEVFFARLHLNYARYYGRDVSYRGGGGYFFGHPAFVLGALAVTDVANSHARSRANADAQAQWREWQVAAVWVTNQRLVVQVDGAWLTFSYDAMTAVYPEVSARTLVCQFGRVEPMLLTGSDAPIAAVYTVLQTSGPEALAQHPSLRALDAPAPEPSLPAIGKAKPASA